MSSPRCVYVADTHERSTRRQGRFTIRHTAAERQLFADTRGVAALEFLLAFMPLLLMFLGSLQLALLFAADMVVRHAAVTGVRSAIVTLDDDPKYYAGAERGRITEKAATTTAAPQSDWGNMFKHLDASGIVAPGPTSSTSSAITATARLLDIRRASYLPLAAIAPDPLALALDGLPTHSLNVSRELGTTPSLRLGTALLRYTPAMTAVVFPQKPDDDAVHDTNVPSAGEVTVRVTHLYRCGIPVAASLVCSSFEALSEQLDTSNISAWLTSIFDDDATRKRRRRAFSELDAAMPSTWAALLRMSHARYRLLWAEATLPNHSASYEYSED